MSDTAFHGVGSTDEIRQFIDKYHQLLEDGSTRSQALDALDDEFSALVRKVFPPHESVQVLNPEQYTTLIRVCKALTIMGFSDDEVSFEINQFTGSGFVSIRSVLITFDGEFLDMLSEILQNVTAVELIVRPGDLMEISFTVPRVIKPL